MEKKHFFHFNPILQECYTLSNFNQKDMIRLNGRKLKKCFAQPLLAKILGILEMISIRISTRYSIELRNTLTSEVEVAKVHIMWFCF